MDITKIIKQEFLPLPSLRRSGQKLKQLFYIVCHDTGNPGATAAQNVKYYTDTADKDTASAHYFVDDTEIINCIPETEKAWHCRYNAGIAPNVAPTYANDSSLGIELCFGGNIDTHASYKNYVALIAHLCKDYNLDPKQDLVAHSKLDPTRRKDPENAFHTIGKTWEQFVVDVSQVLEVKDTHMDHTTTPKVLKIKNVTVTYDEFENGETIVSDHSVSVKVTPEMIALLANQETGLVIEGYNVTVE